MKVLLLLAVLAYFGAGYLTLNLISSHQSSGSLAIGLDSRLPFIPLFIVIYLLGYPLPVLPYFMIKDMTNYKRAVMAYFFVLSVSFLVFLLYPVFIARPAPEAMSPIFAAVFKCLHAVDGPYNTFPSLHVSLAAVAVLACIDWHKKHLWLLVWPPLIAASAVLIKQHYIWDVLGGLALGGLAYLFFMNPRTRLVDRLSR